MSLWPHAFRTQPSLVDVRHVTQTPETVVLRPGAPWRDTSAAILLQLIEVHTRTGASIIIDLTGCPNANTSQLAVIIAGIKHARTVGALVTVEARPALRRLAELCRVEHLVRWQTSVVAL